MNSVVIAYQDGVKALIPRLATVICLRISEVSAVEVRDVKVVREHALYSLSEGAVKALQVYGMIQLEIWW